MAWLRKAGLQLMAGLLSSSSSSCCASSAASMAATFEEKRALRSRLRRELRLHHPSLRQIEDPAIQSHVLQAPWYNDSSSICAYISCPSLREVDTSQIVSDILQRSHSDPPKRLYVPWIEDKESHMKLFHIDTNEDLQANSMGILEPTLIDGTGFPRKDGLAFDLVGRRLGRGGGYYDTFLKNYLLHAEGRGWKPPLLVGLAYSLQVVDKVPTDAKDIPVDGLVSSSGWIPISSRFQ